MGELKKAFGGRFVIKADLDVYLFRDRQGVLTLDAEISDCALQLGVTE